VCRGGVGDSKKKEERRKKEEERRKKEGGKRKEEGGRRTRRVEADLQVRLKSA
jgi:hypothetical protein